MGQQFVEPGDGMRSDSRVYYIFTQASTEAVKHSVRRERR